MRELGKSPKKSFAFIKIFFLTIFLLIVTIVAVKLLNLERYVVGGPKTVVQLITDTGLKSDKGRINILLLGIGGQGHEGPYLTDTIVLASIDKEAKDVVLVSIPRDLWVPNLSVKVNSVYAYGQEDGGGGIELTKKTISGLLGIPVHYVFRVDFRGFIKAVDLVEGIDVDVETAFIDSNYPIAGKEDDLCGLTIATEEIDGVTQEVVRDATGSATPIKDITDNNNPFTCRYETISFNAGLSHMDGAEALKFVRSRHGTNGQGSDFARSDRQQKVILAFRQKILSTNTLLNPKMIIDLAKTFGQSLDTDIADDEIPLFIKLGQKIDSSGIRRVVLDQGRDQSVLVAGNPQDFQGQFVLIPKNNNWTDLAEYIQGEIFKLQEVN